MTWAPGSLAPRPGAAPLRRMLAAQTAAELKLVLRNGEQVLLSLVIPLALVVLLVTVPFITLEGTADGRRADFFVPGVLALAVMSAAFTGQAIAVGFERQYGVLKRLGATPLPRGVLLAAKTLSVLVVEVLQVGLLCAVGLALGWQPQGSPLAVLVLVVAGTGAFSGLGLLLGGTMRGLTTLAAANLLWFVLLVLGGVLFPLSAFGAAEPALSLLPTAALSTGLREVLQDGGTAVREVLVLLTWGALGLTAASRAFRWE
ncbi:MAG: Efflux ABC transporter, permease protein [uncultured Frankineae bacterium]|uniref:Efflux ABC transporter, permease protein n=1 Tax=uncultured Frankineae bacterium TaxID=437475 RepID=A0A6J4LRE9_9ACTN|nr:MAG: Efflux ABC transporter, permease protein [uncultured Frankineae bacterium]